MDIEDRFREAVAPIPSERQLLGGYYVPTEEEGDPHERISRLEGTALALYAGLEFLLREIDDLSERLGRIER